MKSFSPTWPTTVFGIVLILATLSFACQAGRAESPAVPDTSTFQRVAATDSHIHYFGRIGSDAAGNPRLWWPGSAVELRAKSSAISAEINSANDSNEFAVIIDGDVDHATNLVCKRGDAVCPLATGLAPGDHTVMLWLRSETWQPVDFKGFLVEQGASLEKIRTPNRKIEFFGDSITCGYGDEGTSTDHQTAANSNNLMSYGALTARALDAEYRCTARSGIGIETAWNDPVSSGILMPNYYDRLDPNVEHSWNFKQQWTPDAVVINLGENDAGIFKSGRHPDPGADADTAAYKAFVSLIRAAYPKATIFCVLGPMDAVRSHWKDYEAAAVQQLTDAGDKRVFFLPLDIRKGDLLSGPGNHPNLAEHADMAALLIPLVREKMRW